MRMMRAKAYWTVAGEERGAVIAPKDEVGDDEARHAIPQQGRERKHQPRCHIKTFDPRARARDQDRKQVASPGFGRSLTSERYRLMGPGHSSDSSNFDQIASRARCRIDLSLTVDLV